VFLFFFFFFVLSWFFFFFFFFQAEDGIRGLYVTGVQTCALPISAARGRLPTLACSRSCVRPACSSTAWPVSAWARWSRRRWPPVSVPGKPLRRSGAASSIPTRATTSGCPSTL